MILHHTHIAKEKIKSGAGSPAADSSKAEKKPAKTYILFCWEIWFQLLQQQEGY